MANHIDQSSDSGPRGVVSEAATGSSEAVEWQDISRGSPPADGATTEPSQSVSGRVQTQAGDPLTIETEACTVTLIGVPTVTLGDLVATHQRSPTADGSLTRHCALFDIENTGDRPLHWLSRRTTFVGSDGTTYDRAQIALNSAQLAPGCHTTHVQIEPRCRARAITPVEKLPDGVSVSAVISTIAADGRPHQRFRFTV